MRPISLPIAVAVVLLAHAARAEEEQKETTTKTEVATEARGAVDLEVLVGGGQVEALNPIPNSTIVSGQLRYERALTDTVASGIVLSGQWNATREIIVGFRFPVAVASLMPADDVSRSTVNLGNIELEGEWAKELSEQAELFVAAHVALPTASGSELPSEADLASTPQQNVDPVSADKFAVNHAVASAYGYENNAIWLAGYIGLVPVVGMKLHFGRLRIEPYVKLENMFSVRDNAQERAIVELDAGGRVTVTVASFPATAEKKTHFDVGVRAWGSFTLTDHEGNPNVGVVEPELRIGGEQWRVTAGLLVPFVGELRDQGWVSGRLSATMTF
jgi:hypothetical protein